MFRAIFVTLGLLYGGAAWSVAQTSDRQVYRVVGEQAGKGPYIGQAAIETEGDGVKVDWAIAFKGQPQQNTQGHGLLLGGRLAAGFGRMMKGLMVCRLKNGELTGKFMLPTDLGQSAKVSLKLESGTPMNGVYKFTEGLEGTLTLQPRSKHAAVLSGLIETKNGKDQGLAMWTDDILQFVPAAGEGDLGLVSYALGKDDGMHGVWTTGEDVNMESLMVKNDKEKKPISDPRGFPFDKQGYYLTRSNSVPGAPISEERDFLRAGEDLQDFVKLIALRRYSAAQASAKELAEALLLTARDQSEYRSSSILEDGDMDAIHTILFLKEGKSTFYVTLVHRDPENITATHLIIRNRSVLTDEKTFSNHIEEKLPEWLKEMKKISQEAPYFIRITAAMPPLDTAKIKP